MASCFRCGQEWGQASFAFCDFCGANAAPSPTFAEPIRYGPNCSPTVIGPTASADRIIAVVTRSAAYQDTVHLLRRTDGKEIARESMGGAQVTAMPTWADSHYLVAPMASWEFRVFDAQRLKYFTIVSPQGKHEEFGRPQACIRDRSGRLVGIGITDRGYGDRYTLHACNLDLQSRKLKQPEVLQIPKGIPPALLSTLSVLPSVEGSLLLRVNDSSKDYWMHFDASQSELIAIGQTSKLAYALRCEGDSGYIALAEAGQIALHSLRGGSRTIELPENSAYATAIGVYASSDIFVGLVDRTGDHQLLHYRGGLLERSVPHQMPAQVQRLHYMRQQNRLIVLASSTYGGTYVCSIDLARRNVEQLFASSPRSNSLSMIMADWDMGGDDVVFAAGTQLAKLAFSSPELRSRSRSSSGAGQSPRPQPDRHADVASEASIPLTVPPGQPSATSKVDPGRDAQPGTSSNAVTIRATLHTQVTEPIRIQSARDFEMVLISEVPNYRFRITEVFAFYPALYSCEMRAGAGNRFSHEQRISVPIRFLGEGDYRVRLVAHIVDDRGRASQIFVETASLVSIFDPSRQPTTYSTTHSYNSGGGDQVIVNRHQAKPTGTGDNTQ